MSLVQQNNEQSMEIKHLKLEVQSLREAAARKPKKFQFSESDQRKLALGRSIRNSGLLNEVMKSDYKP
jgi:hypothetical protein